LMGLLRRFEKNLERIFEGTFARAFKGGVHPLEIARRLLREMEDGRVMGMREVLAPSRFLVILSPPDHLRLEGMLGSLSTELESLVIDYANRRDYHLPERPRIRFEVDGSLVEGEFEVRAFLEEAPLAAGAGSGGEVSAPGRSAAGAPEGAAFDRRGAITVTAGPGKGTVFELKAERTTIGRDAANDLVLQDAGVSRFHAEIFRIPEGYVIRDLGSTNGTLVGGRRVRERLLEDGDLVRMGGVEMRFAYLPVEGGPTARDGRFGD